MLDWPNRGGCTTKFYLSEGAFGVNTLQDPSGFGQVRPLPIALGSAPDFVSGQVQFAVASELKKLACLHGHGVMDVETFRMANRRLIQA